MDGFELADCAKRLQPALKILYATGYTHISRPNHQLQGKSIYKPYRPDEIALEVRLALKQS